MKARKGYSKGMNRDMSSDKQDPNTYYNLENFRVVTEDGLTTGSLVNESSNQIKFKIPDLDEYTLANGTVIPPQAGLKIIGWTTVIDTIIVFTTNSDDEVPDSYGQIWALKFNETNGSVIGIQGDGSLVPGTHLLYNQKMDFSTYHRIGRAVGRYENSNTQRVYWTDNYNSVRVFNTASEDPLNVPIDNIELAADADMSQPVIETIGTGNLLTNTMVQFAYRLKTTDGAETVMSPASKLMPLPEASIDSTTWGAFVVDMADDNASGINSRSVTYHINGIDQDWDVIEHFAILYTEQDVFTVYLFNEEVVPVSGNLTVICSDLDTAIQIPGVVYNAISSGFDIAKDILVKDNRLIAANTKTKPFTVSYDARAYRFNSSQEGLLEDPNEGNITLLGGSPSYGSVPDVHDAINKYNDESQEDWDDLYQYKFQADGTTYGGSGLNVSYKFTTSEAPANFIPNDQVTQTPPHLTISSWGDATAPITLGTLETDGTEMEFERFSQLKNAAAPYQHSIFKGYARGETYRFGIVFYSPKGSPTFVNWIGDIRMPEPDDGYPLMEDAGQLNGPHLYTLGVEFTIDTSSIAEAIGGYSIVRVRRDASDRSRLGVGIQGWFEALGSQVSNLTSSVIHKYEAQNDPVSAGDPWPLHNVLDVGGTETSTYHLPSLPAWNNTQLESTSSRRVCFLMSPLGQNLEYQFKDEDFLKTWGYHTSPIVQYTNQTAGNDGDKSFGFFYKLQGYIRAADIHPTQRFQIGSGFRMRRGEFWFTGSQEIDGWTGGNGLANAYAGRSGSNNKDVPLGIGNPKVATMLTPFDEVTINNATNPNTAPYANGQYSDSFGNFSGNGNVTTGNTTHRLVSMCRYVVDQYGGPSFEDRSTNQYVATGHYQVVNSNIPQQLTFSAYGGDVYVNYYDDEYIEQYNIEQEVFGEVYQSPKDNRLSVAVCYPTETIINQDYRRSRRWFANRNGTNMGQYQSMTANYDSVWSQEDMAKEWFFAEDFLSNTVEEHPHQMWASQPKIDGELVDSWRQFLANDSIEVTGNFGPINRIMNFGGKVFFYQDSAVGITTIDERVVLNDSSGQELTIGQGGVFPDYTYISVVTGSSHQFSVINTERYIYHWDARLKKIYRTNQEGCIPISDLNGMSSWFHNLVGEQLSTDITLRSDELGGPVGVHAVPDYRYNRVLFTFLDPEWDTTSDTKQPGFTVSFNEMFNSFESFYSFVPGIYLQYGRRLLSATPGDLNAGWEHNVSTSRGSFYGTTYDSVLETILGEGGSITKTFDTLQWQGTMTNNDGEDVQQTFSSLRVYNEFQDTGVHALVPGDNLKRHLRLWRTLVPRDVADFDPRIRAPWTHVVLKANNHNHYKNTIKDLEYSFRPSKN